MVSLSVVSLACLFTSVVLTWATGSQGMLPNRAAGNWFGLYFRMLLGDLLLLRDIIVYIVIVRLQAHNPCTSILNYDFGNL